ncbi:MAG: TIGR04282 family arsenosugar biosynthesis glycosyltransferase [Myxococcales bacterium]|nr:MAG: TIGR04282 family arsenosugar biosynthesis glycosyltransferase [Myxococcales bacterium]
MELAQLAVFVRPPAEGAVKTRLQSLLGASGAAALYEAFVEDTIALCDRVRAAGRVDVALWADGLEHEQVTRWGRALAAVPRLQPDGDLGVRMATAFDEGLCRYERVVIIGSDAPTLPLELIVAAFNALDHAPLVLGPANDGGYYAIGATHPTRPCFDGVRWSTPYSLSDTLVANSDLDVALLPPWYDIDEPDDLDVLRAHLSVSPRAAPATARCLRNLAPRSKIGLQQSRRPVA